MSTMTKVFVVLTAVFSIVLSVLTVSAVSQWDNWKQLAHNYEAARDAEITNRASAMAAMHAAVAAKDLELSAKQGQLAAATQQIQTLTDEVTKLKGENTQIRNERIAFEADRTKLQEILDVTAGQLKDSQKQNGTLTTQNMDLQSRNAKLNARVVDLNTQVTILTDQTRNIQEKLFACENRNAELQRVGAARPSGGPTVETPAGVVAAQPRVAGSIRGAVTEVNGNYASIDVGESSGIVSGMTLMIYRDNTYLGELVVDKVRPKEAGGRIASQAKDEIRKGDIVWYSPEN